MRGPLLALAACTETGLNAVNDQNAPPSVAWLTPPADDHVFPACDDLDLVAVAWDVDHPDAALGVEVVLDDVTRNLARHGAKAVLRLRSGVLAPDSSHGLGIVATDPEGLSATASLSFRLAANGPPDTWILFPPDGAFVMPGEILTVVVDVADADEGAAGRVEVAWKVDGAEVGTGTAVDDDGRASLELDTALFDTGAHTLTITAVDGCGAAADARVSFAIGCTDVWHADTDGHGHGDPLSTTTYCRPPAGYVGNADDCDDTDPAVGPCDSADDGSICPTQMGTDDNKVPT